MPYQCGVPFFRPVKVGNVVSCYGKIARIGTTSITINLEFRVKPTLTTGDGDDGHFKVTYVAFDEQGNKQQVFRTPPATGQPVPD